jgi:hypothetical protein
MQAIRNRLNKFAGSRLFGKAQGARRTGGVWPQQPVTNKILRPQIRWRRQVTEPGVKA